MKSGYCVFPAFGSQEDVPAIIRHYVIKPDQAVP
jgi:hypothetical protein